MSKSSKNSAEEFDQSICFTFFSTWVDALHAIAETDSLASLRAFFILSDFCLYGIEPDPQDNPWGFAWPLVEREARRSISNRRRGFGAEDVALSDAIRSYKEQHPNASQRAIAEALDCSLGKVNKVLNTPPVPPKGNVPVHVHVHGNGNGEHNSLSICPVEQDEEEIFGVVAEDAEETLACQVWSNLEYYQHNLHAADYREYERGTYAALGNRTPDEVDRLPDERERAELWKAALAFMGGFSVEHDI